MEDVIRTVKVKLDVPDERSATTSIRRKTSFSTFTKPLS